MRYLKKTSCKLQSENGVFEESDSTLCVQNQENGTHKAQSNIKNNFMQAALPEIPIAIRNWLRKTMADNRAPTIKAFFDT